MSVDLTQFELLLAELELRGGANPKLFDRRSPLLLSRAPGRLDVMGGFADYSGSLTLEMPIREAAFVAVQETDEPLVRVRSAGFGPAAGPLREAAFPSSEIREHSQSYARARAYFQRRPEQAWTGYVAGALAALRVELEREIGLGLNILVASNVPEGKGVSSSAAIEVASFCALSSLYGVHVEPIQTAVMCQRIENLVVGAPCGLMDQMTSSCGLEGQLLPLLCQPAELQTRFAIPPELGLWGIDSGLRHQVSGADYGEVRVAAFMGYAMIARALGFVIEAGPEQGRIRIKDDVYRGYLANVSPASFEKEHRANLPERLSGAEFLGEFAGISDPITRVAPEAVYRVRAATAHPIYEHRRAGEFRDLMQHHSAKDKGPRLGELMYEAHDSYSACGLGSTGTDRIVELVRKIGVAGGLFGAKITGGGSGGTVAVLGRAEAEPAIRAVIRDYAGETGHAPHLFWGSSPGAAQFGIAEVIWTGDRWRVESKVRGQTTTERGAP